MGKKILFCNCCSERIEHERLNILKENLIKSNIDLFVFHDLCDVSVHNKENLKGIFNKSDEYLVIGCHKRAITLLFQTAGVDTRNYSFRFVDFLESDNNEIIRETDSFRKGSDHDRRADIIEISKSDEWFSWYPVIDYPRCTSCGQCADFCLFGVYDKQDGKIKVVNPEGCKINCPACARICPQTAIIFPKYKQGGAIGGSDVIDEISEQKRQTEDINTLLNGDIYSALEQRKIKRKSIIREEAMKKVIEERLNALNNIKSGSE